MQKKSWNEEGNTRRREPTKGDKGTGKRRRRREGTRNRLLNSYPPAQKRPPPDFWLMFSRLSPPRSHIASLFCVVSLLFFLPEMQKCFGQDPNDHPRASTSAAASRQHAFVSSSAPLFPRRRLFPSGVSRGLYMSRWRKAGIAKTETETERTNLNTP